MSKIYKIMNKEIKNFEDLEVEDFPRYHGLIHIFTSLQFAKSYEEKNFAN